jgi:drug/metabolite transporter (DMT)-like permease
VAVVVGLLILGEPITWYEPVGAAIVLFGIAYSQGRIRQSGSIQSANGGGR